MHNNSSLSIFHMDCSVLTVNDKPLTAPPTHLMVGWIADLRFYVLFNSTSVILGELDIDNERLYAMELCLRLRSPNGERTISLVNWNSVLHLLTSLLIHKILKLSLT